MSSIWPITQLGDLSSTVQYGYTASSGPGIAGPKLLRIMDIAKFPIEWDTVPHCEISPQDEEKFALHHGDIVVARTGQGSVGSARFVAHPQRSVFASYLVRFEVAPEHCSRYVGYIVESADYERHVRANAGGASRPSASAPVLASFPVPTPPLQVQEKIAAVLAAYDELIENNLRRIEVLEEMAQAVYREWFVNFRFPGHEDVPLVDSPLGPIPEGWEASTIGDTAENFDRLRKPLSKMQRAEMQGEYPYYGAAKVFDFVNDYIFDGEYLLVAEDGSVTTPDGYPVLQLASGKFWANNHTHILQGLYVSTHYLYLALSRVQIMGYVTGAAQPKITQGALNRIPIVVPTQSIRRDFEDLMRPMFDLRYNLLTQNAKLRTTRDLLLPRLVSGEIDVSDLDIDTEWLAS